MQLLPKVFYNEETGSIEDGDSILYEADSIAHLRPPARLRLVELCNLYPCLNYEACEELLITEGLYSPEEGERC
jgi:hypothetical protein